MPESGLAKKMKLKPGAHAAIIDAPPGYLKSLEPLPDGVKISSRLNDRFDWVQVFVKNRVELEAMAASAIAALKPASTLWITFPKGSSKIQTDLTRDKGWEVLQGSDLKWVNLVSVNETWSAFAMRPHKPGEPRQSFR